MHRWHRTSQQPTPTYSFCMLRTPVSLQCKTLPHTHQFGPRECRKAGSDRIRITQHQHTAHNIWSARVLPCPLRATCTAPAHSTRHTTVCSLLCLCACVPHSTGTQHTQKLLALVLYTQDLVRSRPVASCRAPVVTHHTHSNLFTRALRPRSRCALVATHHAQNNLFTRALWPSAAHQ